MASAPNPDPALHRDFAVHPDRVLRVAVAPGVTPTKWVRLWRERLPGRRLELVEVAEADQRRVLDAGEADLCLARLPLDTAGLHVIRLYDEVRVAWVSKDHPIAVYDQVSRADLEGERVLLVPDAAALTLASQAEAVLLVPMSIARSHSRRDMASVPVADADPTTIALVWLQEDPHPLTDEFIGIVRGRSAASSRTTQERGRRR